MAHVEDRWKSDAGRKGNGLRWRVRYRNNQNKHRTKSFHRRTEADRFAREIERSLDYGTFIDPKVSQITFDDYACNWLNNANNLRENTVVSYEGIIRNHFVPLLGSTPLAALTPDDFRHLIKRCQANGLSDSSINKICRTAKTILQTAVNDRIIHHNPLDGVRFPKESQKEIRFLTVPQLAGLVEAIDPHYQTFVLSAGILGARSGELRGLHPRNLDLKVGQLNVVEQLTEVRGTVKIVPPKTSAGTRKITLPKFLVSHLEEQTAERSTEDLVFPTENGAPIRRSNFTQRIWQPAIKAAGLNGFTFHELRHTAVALSIQIGAHPKAIQERLGHSSITITLDRYGHLFPALDAAIADGFDQAYGKTLASPPRPKELN